MADDLGWNHVSWHNPDIYTPRMEKLSADGIRLEKSYVHAKCTPSRAAFMTGRYAWRLGTQSGAFSRYQPIGLNTSIKILPEYLKEAGYATHMVGKWHLGYCNEAYLPNQRGFDTFFGQYSHVTNYYTREVDVGEKKFENDHKGYDFRENDKVSYEGLGEFSTDLFSRKAVSVIEAHNSSRPLFLYVPFQAPHAPIPTPPEKYRTLYKTRILGDNVSQNIAATISALDAAVGNIYDALKRTGLYKNSVLIFTSDNGGGQGYSSNKPLKGHKGQLYEGGVRGVGFINSPLLRQSGISHNKLMFITDWFSTLLNLASLKSKIPKDTDSINMWPGLERNSRSTRSRIILNIDQDNYEGLWSGAVIDGKYKLIWGQDSLLEAKKPEASCNLELYNLQKDPCEKANLAAAGGGKKKKIGELKTILMKEFRSRLVEDNSPKPSRAGFPSNWGGVLSSGWCDAVI
ncbi:arylsulfatase B [Eurytemora carolleeae]|uniref:arylsulfatase B n=1 Tax=Eurytemora carolleeae TaxID=1294199 RepID=UPI000C7906FD|nr:arylsulfatase B [Eurytemora carolleeae]|eukprot:XP_023342636.1 arylsulfatase B-like [Eurytemora affinis]